jgi:hypothetical protein
MQRVCRRRRQELDLGHICTGTGLPPSTSAPGSAQPVHICTGTGLTPPTSAPGSAQPAHICTGTGLTPPASAPGSGTARPHSAPGLQEFDLGYGTLATPVTLNAYRRVAAHWAMAVARVRACAILMCGRARAPVCTCTCACIRACVCLRECVSCVRAHRATASISVRRPGCEPSYMYNPSPVHVRSLPRRVVNRTTPSCNSRPSRSDPRGPCARRLVNPSCALGSRYGATPALAP